MKKTRHIEITAFRRQIVIQSADGPGTAGVRPSVSGDDGTFELTRIDSDEGPASHHDATPAAELALLVETLIGSEGHSTVARRTIYEQFTGLELLAPRQSTGFASIASFDLNFDQLKFIRRDGDGDH